MLFCCEAISVEEQLLGLEGSEVGRGEPGSNSLLMPAGSWKWALCQQVDVLWPSHPFAPSSCW